MRIENNVLFFENTFTCWTGHPLSAPISKHLYSYKIKRFHFEARCNYQISYSTGYSLDGQQSDGSNHFLVLTVNLVKWVLYHHLPWPWPIYLELGRPSFPFWEDAVVEELYPYDQSLSIFYDSVILPKLQNLSQYISCWLIGSGYQSSTILRCRVYQLIISIHLSWDTWAVRFDN